MRKTEPGMTPFWDYIGMKETKIEEAHAELRLDITPELHQRRGSVHGGVLATLIDGAVGSAVRSVLSEEEISPTVELKINYIRPAHGEYLVAKSKLYHRGKSLAFGQAEIFDSNGDLVAVGTGTFMILNTK
ncbi:PaaI family thioesterase [Aneurinibacillus sp. Ricciae_BoGa-3]|uniref:PaaI family thioesterase n=1 Tax=Aneurinibacillus sp. Ricciae_BoGa-3 TaxID=3022697 RepID=UPI0023409C54|nr:PaaI family thioesterase [Aneurinibacillus sp. Ricciae_BoGa-3]WCK53259.1 PaaI family thioesterase [Aneurinibacillus sp. Ricciae_BoGa-3]